VVSLARERAPGAQIVLASAEQLPCPNAPFTAMAMSIAFFFLPDPLAALREAHGVLAPGGRIAIYTTSPKLRGTPAAPEPLASRSHFHEKDERVALADTAGFDNIAVSDQDGGHLLTANT
jgi:ubiquinone/menaquinone biosynthesis C-methylase UbiE